MGCVLIAESQPSQGMSTVLTVSTSERIIRLPIGEKIGRCLMQKKRNAEGVI